MMTVIWFLINYLFFRKKLCYSRHHHDLKKIHYIQNIYITFDAYFAIMQENNSYLNIIILHFSFINYALVLISNCYCRKVTVRNGKKKKKKD